MSALMSGVSTIMASLKRLGYQPTENWKYMFDASNMFDEFYRKHVVLPREMQSDLHHKKDLNVKRLKQGLREYNDEHGTIYRVVDSCVQGSVAMSTVVQNENNDYDIDVAVVFEKNELGDMGARAIRNVVANALHRKAGAFRTEPEVKTGCVRIAYAEGYHVDFAVYRRERIDGRWRYEHAGADWTRRDLRGLTDWFKQHNEMSRDQLRKVVRLSKMFCKSRDSWTNMPSGLIQTVLCDEKLRKGYERTDELFYHTMKEIVRRIEVDTTVSAPVDNGRQLVTRQSDKQKMINWKNRLKSKLEDLDVLFEADCTEADAIQAWFGFFNHDFWSRPERGTNGPSRQTHASASAAFRDTEQFIEDMYPVKLQYAIEFSCTAEGNGFRELPLQYFLSKHLGFLPHNCQIKCVVDTGRTTVPGPYEVMWKVKNVGPVAERKDCIRGQIVKRGFTIIEHSNFFGPHYIECYAIKNGVCVARKRIDVPIGR